MTDETAAYPFISVWILLFAQFRSSCLRKAERMESDMEQKGTAMRLDKYLKVSRLIKRRTVANEACDAGRVSANGRPVKASYDVKAGDILEIQFGQRTVKLEVLVVADNVRKDDATAMYREIL